MIWILSEQNTRLFGFDMLCLISQKALIDAFERLTFLLIKLQGVTRGQENE